MLEIVAAGKFFEFFRGQGAGWWFVDAQERKVKGKRGALLGEFFRSRYAWPAPRAAAAAARLEASITAAGRGRRGVDLICRESPDAAGRRVVFVDDLDGLQVDELLDWWQGALVILATSPGNHQALLVTPRPLLRGEHQAALQALIARFAGDPKAGQSEQFHRFPGSRNNKFECLVAGGPFTTRVVAQRDGNQASAARQLDTLLAARATPSRLADVQATVQAPVQNPGRPGRDDSNSGRAMSWTLQQLWRGTDHAEILHGLSTTWLGGHNPKTWPLATLTKALSYMASRR